MKTSTTTTKKSRKQSRPLMGNPVPPTFKKDLHIFEDEKHICRCTHIDRDAAKFAIHEAEGMEECVECDICGAIFNPNLITKEYVKDTVNRMLNIMETIKLINVSMDVDDEEYIAFLNIIPYIKRVPYIYEKANEDFNNAACPDMDISKTAMGPYGGIMPPPFVPINNYYQHMYGFPGGLGNPLMGQGVNMMGVPVTPMDLDMEHQFEKTKDSKKEVSDIKSE